MLNPDGARVLVFLGSLLGHTSPVRTYSPLLGAEITLLAGGALRLDVDPAFEHGVLADTGQITVADATASPGQLVYLPAGASTLRLRSPAGEPARVLLLGGRPLGEQIVMWWNFIGRSHEEIAEFRAQWQEQRAQPRQRPGRYGRFPRHWQTTLPAPELPNARLRLRG